MPQIGKLNNTQSCKQEFVNILLYVEANPVQMRCQCLYSAVMANSKRDYYPLYQFMLQSWNQKTAQSLVNTLVLFSWHNRLP